MARFLLKGTQTCGRIDRDKLGSPDRALTRTHGHTITYEHGHTSLHATTEQGTGHWPLTRTPN